MQMGTACAERCGFPIVLEQWTCDHKHHCSSRAVTCYWRLTLCCVMFRHKLCMKQTALYESDAERPNQRAARVCVPPALPAGELESLTTPPPADQLERAKAMSISLIQGALESKAASAEDLGRQILTYGHRCAQQKCLQGFGSVTSGAHSKSACSV
jgi:hypothetical protein